MSMTHRLDPALERVVLAARVRAAEAGELLAPGTPAPKWDLSEEARTILAEWIADGGYATAVAQVVAEDPQLATQ